MEILRHHPAKIGNQLAMWALLKGVVPDTRAYGSPAAKE